MVVLTLSGDGPSHVAGRESQRNRRTRHQSSCERRNDFVDLLLVHIRSFWGYIQ